MRPITTCTDRLLAARSLASGRDGSSGAGYSLTGVTEPPKKLATYPLAVPETAGAWYRRWHLVAVDGATLDLADTQANDAHSIEDTQTVEEGAEIIVRMAQSGPDGPIGGYFGAAGPLPR